MSIESVEFLCAAKLVHDYSGDSMPNYDDAAELFVIHSSAPKIVLFISHRWRTSTNPGPDGATLRALKSLLESIHQTARGIDPCFEATIPDIGNPLMLRANIVLYRLFEFGLEGDDSLENIGVFSLEGKSLAVFVLVG